MSFSTTTDPSATALLKELERVGPSDPICLRARRSRRRARNRAREPARQHGVRYGRVLAKHKDAERAEEPREKRVGVPDATGSAFVRVRVELSSGASMIFDVSEEIFDGLELLRERGLGGTKLCEAWLGAAAPREPPVLMHVFGIRANGVPIDIRVHCAADHPVGQR